MCLRVLPGEKIRIARKNMVVWKLLNTDLKGNLRSPHMHFLYWRRRRYTPVNLVIKHMEISGFIKAWGSVRVVNEGFHSFTTLRPKCHRMIIPKGSQYVLGARDEIVSSHIRFPRKGE